MDTIKAADNLVIELGRGLWQLTRDLPNERPLLIASVASPALAYRPLFGQARQLPEVGGLPVNAIEEVVVGWSRADKAWHLGLLLQADLAAARGGRWCELARWPDEVALMAADQAQEAGATLADIINRPFRFVEAPHMAAAPSAMQQVAGAQPPAPVAPTGAVTEAGDQREPKGLLVRLAESEAATRLRRPEELDARLAEPEVVARDNLAEVLAADVHDAPQVVRVRRQQAELAVELPMTLESWTLRPIHQGLQWVRNGVWSLGAIGRVLFRVVIGIMFLWLSVMSLQSQFAPVQPTGLPYLGIAIGLGVLFSALRMTQALLRTEAFVIDTASQQVRRHRDLTSDVKDTYDFAEIRAVVVTQVAQQKHPGRGGERDMMTHEAWLHLLLYEPRQEFGKQRRVKPADAYITIGHIDTTTGYVIDEHFENKQRGRLPQVLFPEDASTPAQQVALIMARALGVRAYIDQR